MQMRKERNSDMNELGNKISRKRKDIGMTQTDFAERLCVTRQTVSRWEAGTVMPDIDKIADIASILGVSCDYLLCRTDDARIEAPELISVDDHYPKEGQYVMAFTRWLVPVPSVYFRAAFMDCTERSVANIRLKDIEFWSPMPRLPDGKKWPGQESIEGMVKK